MYNFSIYSNVYNICDNFFDANNRIKEYSCQTVYRLPIQSRRIVCLVRRQIWNISEVDCMGRVKRKLMICCVSPEVIQYVCIIIRAHFYYGSSGL